MYPAPNSAHYMHSFLLLDSWIRLLNITVQKGQFCAHEDTHAPRTCRSFTYMIQRKCEATWHFVPSGTWVTTSLSVIVKYQPLLKLFCWAIPLGTQHSLVGLRKTWNQQAKILSLSSRGHHNHRLSLSCPSAVICQGCHRPEILEDRRKQFVGLVVHSHTPTRVFRVL